MKQSDLQAYVVLALATISLMVAAQRWVRAAQAVTR